MNCYHYAQAELLEAGSSLDIVNGFGLTPLHVAALEGHSRAVAWILANNGDANKKVLIMS